MVSEQCHRRNKQPTLEVYLHGPSVVAFCFEPPGKTNRPTLASEYLPNNKSGRMEIVANCTHAALTSSGFLLFSVHTYPSRI
jgi:hypothetical protein